MADKNRKREEETEDQATPSEQQCSAERVPEGHMDFLTGLASQISLVVVFVVCLGFAFHFLGKERYTPALWLGLAAWMSIGFGITFYIQQYIFKIASAKRNIVQVLEASQASETKNADESGEPAPRTVPAEPLPKKTKTRGLDVADKNKPPSIDNRITNSPIVNSPGSVQAPGGHVTVNQGAWLMSGEEQQIIIRTLTSHAPATIHLLMIGDSDARKYANQIAYAIDAAGWHFEPVNYAMMMPGVYGVHILISDPDVRATVVSAFKAAGIPAAEGSSMEPRYPNGILVGLKP